MSRLLAKKRGVGWDALSRRALSTPFVSTTLLPSPLEVRENSAGAVGGGQLGRLIVRSSRRAQEHTSRLLFVAEIFFLLMLKKNINFI